MLPMIVAAAVGRVSVPQLVRKASESDDFDSGSVVQFICSRAGTLASAAFIDPMTGASGLLSREILVALVQRNPKTQDLHFEVDDKLLVKVN